MFETKSQDEGKGVSVLKRLIDSLSRRGGQGMYGIAHKDDFARTGCTSSQARASSEMARCSMCACSHGHCIDDTLSQLTHAPRSHVGRRRLAGLCHVVVGQGPARLCSGKVDLDNPVMIVLASGSSGMKKMALGLP